ncbi:hypothetical protein CSOJ01_04474 [Colletotrichum sojae]|uniref:Uncharacterized protein n=1 Tax=Colletotrichum sojae TaxID=2175907 RepID=A0A8H6JJ10_9PEZI|nr:hypothetical protein CSOJ01_04474 [Colletotrichum sojae]
MPLAGESVVQCPRVVSWTTDAQRRGRRDQDSSFFEVLDPVTPKRDPSPGVLPSNHHASAQHGIQETLDGAVVETVRLNQCWKATWDTSSDLRKDIIASRCAHVEGRPPFVEQTASVPISEPASARFGQVMLAF